MSLIVVNESNRLVSTTTCYAAVPVFHLMPIKSTRKERKQASRKAARELLVGLVSGAAEPYEAYRHLYRIWCGHNSAVQELRPFFRIPGVEPDGRLSVTEDFKQQVLALAAAILPKIEE